MKQPCVWVLEIFWRGKWKSMSGYCYDTRKDAREMLAEIIEPHEVMRVRKYVRAEP